MVSANTGALVSVEDLRRICGDLPDHKIVSILELKPSIAQLEAAAAWVTSGSDVTGEDRLRLNGKTGEICDILLSGGDFLLEEEEP